MAADVVYVVFRIQVLPEIALPHLQAFEAFVLIKGWYQPVGHVEGKQKVQRSPASGLTCRNSLHDGHHYQKMIAGSNKADWCMGDFRQSALACENDC